MAIPYIERIIRIKTSQSTVDEQPIDGESPMREWQVDLWVLTADGEEIPANIFEKCIYRLHPTFTNPTRIKTKPPFTLREKGWGEFSYPIQCFFLQGGGEVDFLHELSFHENIYFSDVRIKVPIHIPELRHALERSGTVPSYTEESQLESMTLDLDKWIRTLVAGDEDIATEVVNKIIHHPAISREIDQIPLAEQFVLDLRQLPNSLLEELMDFVKKLQAETEDNTDKSVL
ncbi:LANO_0H14686g1_1 [Lachancea nothofagi CBS 11611]|uniref:LANO_0H14686g1_1 n=1 Tax=Lachancea nothofagi CBS 11611 TaxID=1266666 RepID=A0A1G4KMQ2_9SACH|nr:LANO_0H14686g1_1 [Lachancea nothofagi CBS 11611]